MHKKIITSLLVVVLAGFLFSNVMAQSPSPSGAPQPYKYKDKFYYKVTSEDKTMDTGTEVCAKAGLSCVGYTALTTDVCKGFNPKAKTVSDANGSKAGFYCNGSPQGGVCGNEKDTCHICPNCNLNMDCDTQIGDLYRETYVECSDPTGTVKGGPGFMAKFYGWSSNWWGKFRSTVAQSFNMYRQKLQVLLQTKIVKKVKVQVTGPNGTTVETEIPSDSYVCEFYQKNKKLATCGALAAADQFCVTAMNSQHAKAELCQDDGIIICSNPCTTTPQQIKPKQCTFDNDRPRGKQAPPLDFCDQTIKVSPGATPGNKKAGQECAHGGECATGICLGQPSDQGIKYFCSCNQTRHDTSCNKP